MIRKVSINIHTFVFKTGVMAKKADSESSTKHQNVHGHSRQISLVKYYYLCII